MKLNKLANFMTRKNQENIKYLDIAFQVVLTLIS